MYFRSVIRGLFIAFAIMALVTGPKILSAQSPTKAPRLGVTTINAIRTMAVINGRTLPAVQGRGLVVAFFASWCPPCRPEFGELNKLRRMFSPDDVNIVAINLFEDYFADKSGVRMKRFLGETRPEFTVLQAKDDTAIRQAFGRVDRIPTVFVYDRIGNPVYTFIHKEGASKMHVTATEIEPRLREALASPTQ